MNEPNHPYQRLPRDQIAAVLHARGITPTQQRVEIAYVLLGQPRHMSAEQVLNQVNRGEVAVSKATVYNTLGLLREVEFDASFIFKYSPRPHTAALNYEDDVPRQEKERRHRLALELQKGISRRKARKI